MTRCLCRLMTAGAWCAGTVAMAQVSIIWNSDVNAVNRLSTGQPMDSGFRFELGVFTGSFVPTPANTAEWSANWHAAQRKPYDAVYQMFSGSFTPPDNDLPFAANKDAYVWGFRGDPASGEWILFRAASWKWPYVDPFFPPAPTFRQWYAKDATAILGTVNTGGVLMQSAAVTNAAPPPTSWAQWQGQYLAGEVLDGPADDPDHDGVCNLMEFVFGTLPKSAGAPTMTPVNLVDGHLEITIPRRIDHPAVLTVEVSGDLVTWNSGPSSTSVIDDGPAALVVRDLTSLDATHPRRFIRLRASLP